MMNIFYYYFVMHINILLLIWIEYICFRIDLDSKNVLWAFDILKFCILNIIYPCGWGRKNTTTARSACRKRRLNVTLVSILWNRFKIFVLINKCVSY